MNTRMIEKRKKILKVILDDFRGIVDNIVGTYFDARRGFYLLVEEHHRIQKETLESLKKTDPEKATREYLDATWTMYGTGNPNEGTPEIFHTTTQRELRDRNLPAGRNAKFLGNICVATIYQFWEDHYRERIASVFDVEKTEVRSDLFGDLRLLRNSIIHNSSIAITDIEKCKVLKWFRKGDEIFIDGKKFEEITKLVRELRIQITASSSST